MKLHKIIITALLLGITINIVQAQEKTNPIQKDTLNPYLYADSARPYNQNPMTWDNYSEFKDKLEISDLIMEAENKKDYRGQYLATYYLLMCNIVSRNHFIN